MTSFILKVIGIFTMLCDHSSDVFIGHFSFLNLIGRITFPIFAFQIAQGYIHTNNLKKYILRLFIFACISQIPFMLFLSTFNDSYYLNIFFTLVLGTITLLIYDKIKNKFLATLLITLILFIAHFIQVDYGLYGVLVIFLFYVFNTKYKKHKVLMYLSFILITALKYLTYIINNPIVFMTYINCIIFTCISLIPICLYNGKQGPKVKYLFYIFYPVHLLILYLLSF